MPDTSEHHVAYGTQEVRFCLERRKRKTLAIEVHPDGSVQVKAPMRAPLRDIRARVEHRGGWILKQQRRFAELPPPLPPRQYVSGEGYLYLGRQLRLKVLEGKPQTVRLVGDRLVVTASQPTDTQHVRRVLERWYRERAEAVFNERLEVCRHQVEPFGIQHSGEITLRRMRKRWGSCSADGHILLNTHLVGAPTPCIDYVLLHELCHVAHHNHSRAFYDLLNAVLPDWRERKRQLDISLTVHAAV